LLGLSPDAFILPNAYAAVTEYIAFSKVRLSGAYLTVPSDMRLL